MVFEIRPARAEDIEHIVPWTSDTFSWGDYVPEQMAVWLTDDLSTVLVAVLKEQPVGLVHGLMLSSTEAWLEAARVHPDHRRIGLGNALNRAGVKWATQQGAQVVRLAVVDSNQPAINQVLALGYRQTSAWAYCELVPASTSDTQIRHATSADAHAAWMSWSTSDLHRAGRGLITSAWQWRTAKPQDLTEAVDEGRFFQSPVGWLLTDQVDTDVMHSGWVATAPENAPEFLKSVLDLAAELDVESVRVKTPSLPWMMEAMRRAGGEPSEVFVFSKSIYIARD